MKIDNVTIEDNGISSATGEVIFNDDEFTIVDDGDNTKKAMFQASSITTSTTRTYTFPDVNGFLLTDANVSGTSNQVILTDIGNEIRFSLPQSIGTSNVPTFAGAILQTGFGTQLTIRHSSALNNAQLFVDSGGNLNITPSGSNVNIASASLDVATNITVGGTVDGVDIAGTAVTTWGNGLEYTSGTAAVDYNTVNLKITAGELNTIQDIHTTAAVSFGTVSASTITASTNLNGSYLIDGQICFPSSTKVSGDSTFFWDNTSKELGVGTGSPSAKIHSLATTEQLRLGYDASNYASFTVNSSGQLIIVPTSSTVRFGSGNTTTTCSLADGRTNLGYDASNGVGYISCSASKRFGVKTGGSSSYGLYQNESSLVGIGITSMSDTTERLTVSQITDSCYVRIEGQANTAGKYAGIKLREEAVASDTGIDLSYATNDNLFVIRGITSGTYDGDHITMERASGNTTFNGTLTVTGSTEAVEVIDSGSTGATEQDWIEVEVGGVTGYIRVFATK